MTEPTPNDVSHALQVLQSAGYTWLSEDDGELREHLARHAPGSPTVGSKYSVRAWLELDTLYQQAKDRCIVALAQAHETGQPLRVEVAIDYPHAGTDGVASGLVCAGLSTLTRTRIVRDPGTIYEQSLEAVVVAQDQEFPVAHQLIAAAGVLGDTRQLGVYTLFPGSASRPFPREDQAVSDPVFHQANVAFWRDHFFLATPSEALLALQKGLDSLRLMPSPPQETMQYHEDEIQRLSDLQRNYTRLAYPSSRSP